MTEIVAPADPRFAEPEGSSVWARTRASLIHDVHRSPHDSSRWEEFYRTYWRYVYSCCRGWGLSHHLAEDVVHDVMVKVLKKLPDFVYTPAKGRFRGWLRTIARNTMIDVLRKQGRRPEGHTVALPDGDATLEFLVNLNAKDDSEQQSWAWQNTKLAVAMERVRERVNPTTWRAFEMLVFEAKTGDEAAEELGVTRNTVFLCKRNVLTPLREEMAKLEKTEQ